MKATEMMGQNLPLWVINLPGSSERRRFAEQQVARFHRPFEFIDGVDGASLHDDEMKRVYSRKEAVRCTGRPLMPGEIGCALAHIRVWQRLVAGTAPEALIAEDDVLLGAHFFDVVDRRSEFPADWELMNFHTDSLRVVVGELIYDIHRACRFVGGGANRLTAYLVNRRGAEKLLSHAFPIRWPADGLTAHCEVTGLVAYGVEPQIASYRAVRSDALPNGVDIPLSTAFRIREVLTSVKRGVRRALVHRSDDTETPKRRHVLSAIPKPNNP